MTSRRITLQDVADELGLSANTISRALSGKSGVSETTRARIKAEAKRMGYAPNGMARSLVLGSPMTIGILITNPSNPFYAHLISGIEQRCRVAGYSTLLMISEENAVNEARAVESLLRWGVDGAICVPVQGSSDEHWHRLEHSGIPLVIVNRMLTSVTGSFVGIDYEQAAYDATVHLRSVGARRLYLLEEDLDISTVQSRVRGFQRAASDALDLSGVQIVRVPTQRRNADTLPWEADGAYRIARELVTDMPTGSGVLVGSDYFALGMYRALRENGFRPGHDVALAGFGDHPFSAYLEPSLTTVRLPARQLGTAAVDLLLERDSRRESNVVPQRTRLFEAELLVRASSRLLPVRASEGAG